MRERVRLTEKQVEYLMKCAEAPQSPWDAGSTTVSRLRAEGLIKFSATTAGHYVATDAGRAWLRGES